MSKLKTVFHKGAGIDEEINSAFSHSSPASVAKTSFSERVLESQQKFNQQFQSKRPSAEIIPKTDMHTDFGRFDENFVPERHLDDFDETKNIETFRKVETGVLQPPPPLRPISAPEKQNVPAAPPREDLRELATATPRRNISLVQGGEMERVLEELEDIKAQNSDILRRIQRMEEKLRR